MRNPQNRIGNHQGPCINLCSNCNLLVDREADGARWRHRDGSIRADVEDRVAIQKSSNPYSDNVRSWTLKISGLRVFYILGLMLGFRASGF